MICARLLAHWIEEHVLLNAIPSDVPQFADGAYFMGELANPSNLLLSHRVYRHQGPR